MRKRRPDVQKKMLLEREGEALATQALSFSGGDPKKALDWFQRTWKGKTLDDDDRYMVATTTLSRKILDLDRKTDEEKK